MFLTGAVGIYRRESGSVALFIPVRSPAQRAHFARLIPIRSSAKADKEDFLAMTLTLS